jgi:hypothetical protein
MPKKDAHPQHISQKCHVSTPTGKCLHGEAMRKVLIDGDGQLGTMQGVVKFGYSYTNSQITGSDCFGEDKTFLTGSTVNAIRCVIRGNNLRIIAKDSLIIGSTKSLGGRNLAVNSDD